LSLSLSVRAICAYPSFVVMDQRAIASFFELLPEGKQQQAADCDQPVRHSQPLGYWLIGGVAGEDNEPAGSRDNE